MKEKTRFEIIPNYDIRFWSEAHPELSLTFNLNEFMLVVDRIFPNIFKVYQTVAKAEQRAFMRQHAAEKGSCEA